MSEEKSKEEKTHKVHSVLRKGYEWKLATAVFLALLIISMFTGGFKDFFGSSVGAQKAADQAIDFINTNLLQQGQTAVFQDVSELGSVYKVDLKVGSTAFESYITKDGKFLFPSGVDLTKKVEAATTPTTTGSAVADCSDATKSKKPVVELFIMSYCPYGTQIEKGLLPVLKLLKDKVDFKLRFVYYAMHGEKEVKEELRQYCIREEQNSKLLDYLSCFLKDGNSETCLTEAKVDTKKLDSCIQAADNEFKVTENLNDKSKWLSGNYPLFNVDKDLNEKYGVGGSPALVINEKETSSGRAPATLLSTICCAFDEPPAECKQALSTATPSSGFGTSTTASGSAGGCGS